MLPELQQKLTAYDLQTEISSTQLNTLIFAYRVADGLPVLLSILNPKYTFDAYFVRMFQDMGERHLRMEHPHILRQLDVVADNGLLYFVFEFPGGELLPEYLANNMPLTSTIAIPLIQQLATAIDYAHSQGIQHGNFSAHSILLHENQAYLFQFGLARLMQDVTQTNLADPRFLPPERLQGESPARSADLYGLGVLSYLMLTGEFPFSADDEARHRTQPVLPHRHRTEIRPSVSEVILRMLSKDVELRHSTGAEFARAIQVAAEGSGPIRPITAAMMAVKPSKRVAPTISRRWIIRGVLALIVAALTLVAGFWVFTQSDNLRQTFAPPVSSTATLPVPTPTILPTAIVSIVEPSPTAIPTVAASPTPEPTPTNSPLPANTGQAAPFENDVFSRLVLANGITDDYKPLNPATEFSTATETVYLFFHYEGIKTSTPWQVEWQYNGSTVQLGTDEWSADYGSAGTAWVFYSPIDGFKPGNYFVTLSVSGKEVAGTGFGVK